MQIKSLDDPIENQIISYLQIGIQKVYKKRDL